MTDFAISKTPTSFVISNAAGRVVWSARGFATETYRDRALEIALRHLRGRAPKPVDYSEDLKPETVSVIKCWVATWYPNTPKA